MFNIAYVNRFLPGICMCVYVCMYVCIYACVLFFVCVCNVCVMLDVFTNGAFVLDLVVFVRTH